MAAVTNTTNDDENEEWEYLQTLNMCIQLLVVVFLGMIGGYFKLFDSKTFVPQSTRFVFYAALPCLVLNALGININLYDDKFLWDFIIAFLILRIIALVVAIIIVVGCRSSKHNNDGNKGIGWVAVLWLAMTWISTVILGVPIASAVFDNPLKGAKYGVLAAISSFIFQLPLQLFFLECHRLEEEYMLSENHQVNNDDDGDIDDLEIATAPAGATATIESQKVAPVMEENMTCTSSQVTCPVKNISKQEEPVSDYDNNNNDNNENRLYTTTNWANLITRREIWFVVGKKILQNPVLWAIAIGFVLTLSRLGPTYLNSKSEDFVPGLGWITETLAFLGSTVSPISLFTMGIWMSGQGEKMKQINILGIVISMIVKLVILPLLMVGLAQGLDLADEPGRAAVLIAALPISMASFSLANNYKIGENIMAGNVVVGTILILPTVIVWNLVMDKVDLFPIQAT